MNDLSHLIDALEAGASFGVDLRPDYALFRLSGVDVASYLQRRTSNDVLALAVGESHTNAFLDKTARIQCLFHLTRFADEDFLAIVESPLVETFEKEVLKFKIMERFELEQDKSTPLVLWINLSETPENVFPMPTFFMGKSAKNAVLSIGEQAPALEAQVLTPNTFRSLQTLWGVPRYGEDYTSETQLPETTWESFAVSYTKGCFLGQETVAKVNTYGGLKQTLMGLFFEGQSVEITPQSEAFVQNNTGESMKAGYWASAVQWEKGTYALAYLNRAFREPNQTLNVEVGKQIFSAQVELMPFLNLGTANEDKAQRLYDAVMQQFVEGDLNGSIEAMRRLVETYPLFWQAQEGLAVLLGRAERYEEAMEVLQNLIQKNPNWVMAYTNLSIYALRLGSKEEAENWKAEGTRVAMRLKMQEVMAQKKAQQSEEEAEAERQAQFLARRQQLQERIGLFQQALDFSPNDALAYYGLATAYHELEDFTHAVESYAKTIELNPKHSKAFVGWAECLLALGEKKALQNVLQKGIEVASHKGDLQPLARLKELSALS
jgi:folate-binding protein YgfZ